MLFLNVPFCNIWMHIDKLGMFLDIAHELSGLVKGAQKGLNSLLFSLQKRIH